MKKTYNISLGKQIFHLEENAGDKLQSYIETLEAYYSQEEGGNEIMSDIENRIAELFQESLYTSHSEVITLAEVEKVISIMGQPDELISDDSTDPKRTRTTQKLYRDPEHGILGGVAAGLSAYSGISLLVLRILFLALAFFYGINIIIYLILWIVIPPALTAKQKLEMKGEKINISTLEKNIKANVNEVKNNENLQGFFRKSGQFLQDFFNQAGSVITAIGEIIIRIFAILIFILSLAGLFFLGWVLFGTPWELHNISWFGLSSVMPVHYIVLSKIALILAVFPPFLLALWLSIKYLFGIKIPKRGISLTLLVLWIFGIISVLFIGFTQSLNFKNDATQTTTSVLPITQKHLFIKQSSMPFSPSFKRNPLIFYDPEGIRQALFQPDIILKKASGEEAQISLEKRASGFTDMQAHANTHSMEYQWKLKNDTLYLDPYFKLAENTLWRANRLRIYIYLPENYSVHINPALSPMLNRWAWRDYQETDKSYIMTADGLKIK